MQKSSFRLRGHLVHHYWFYIAFVAGVLASLLSAFVDPSLMVAVGGDVFFGVYFFAGGAACLSMTTDQMRAKAASEDEGITLIVLITCGALAVTLVSIFKLLNGSVRPDFLHLALALLSAPLGWFALHMNVAFHYAHKYYGDPDGVGVGRSETGGLKFPGIGEPGPWEFIYYAFVIGMTAQVSDVQVESTWMRQRTLLHSVASFFFNTVFIAMAVNVVVAVLQHH